MRSGLPTRRGAGDVAGPPRPWPAGAAAAMLLLGPPALGAQSNEPPVADFRTSPAADASGTIRGPSPLGVTFNMCRSSDPDPGDELKFLYDFDGDGAFDQAGGRGSCRASHEYVLPAGEDSSCVPATICVSDRQPFDGHQLCRSYTVCPTPDDGKAKRPVIAFASNRDGGYDIYAIDARGRGLVRLTDDPADETSPAWSPDGRRIAFESDRDGGREIYVMNEDGSGQTRLTDTPGDSTGPAWSPDGSRIAFAHGAGGIWIMDADGSDPVRLTPSDTNDHDPAWSPDGRSIVFVRSWSQLCRVNVDGSGLTSFVTYLPRQPAWSPDGSRIVFVVGEAPGISMKALDVATGVVSHLLYGPNFGPSHPAFSPQGDRLAVASEGLMLGVPSIIEVVAADGSGETRALTDSGGAHDTQPTWRR